MDTSSDEEEMMPKNQELLKLLHKNTVKELSEFYHYFDDLFDDTNDSMSLNTNLTVVTPDMKDWLNKSIDWTYTRDKESSLPGYYGELNDYEGELVDTKNKRILYIGGNRHRGLYTSFNVFISATSKKSQYLALLMNHIFMFDGKVVRQKFVEFMDLPFNLDISIHPFKLDNEVSIGLLFSYYCERSEVDKNVDTVLNINSSSKKT